MKAVYINDFGNDLDVSIREVDDRVPPTAWSVLVKVHAAGLNRADLLQAAGFYPPPAGYSPNIPGLEFAGEIAAIGDRVEIWKIGDRVFGITAGEAQAEFVIAEEAEIAAIPDSLSFVEAAAVPESFMTAYDAIFSQGRLGEGETVLIHAVGSGVGLAGLQLAKAAGAIVIGTSRTQDKLDRCLAFGLDHAIMTDGSDFADATNSATGGRGADVILDLVGGRYFDQNLDSLAIQGRLMLVGLTSGRSSEFDLGKALKKRATIIGTTMRARSLEEKAEVTKVFSERVVPMLASGTVRATLDRVFRADDVKSAYRYLASNTSFGKVVLEF